MDSALIEPCESTPAPSWPLARWAVLVALLLGEAMALNLRFDGADLARSGPWWSAWLSRSHVLFDVVVLSVAASLLFGGASLRDEFRRLLRSVGEWGQAWPYLLGHLTAFGAFAWLTGQVWEGGADRSSLPAGGWALAWVAAGLATVLLWAATAIPIAYWLPLVRRGWRSGIVGLAIGIVAWWAGQYTQGLWEPLHRSTFVVVQLLLSLVLPETVCDPTAYRVGTPSFSVSVAPHCSGYEGLGLIWIFLAAYLSFFRRELRFPQSLLLVPIGTVLILLVNVLRIVSLVIIGANFSPAVALGGFHSRAGWLGYIAVCLGLVVVARHSAVFRASDSPVAIERGPNPAVPYLAPLFALIGLGLLTVAFTSGFDRYYPIRVIGASAVLWHFRGRYARLRWVWNWDAVAIGVGVFAVWMALEPAPSGAGPGDTTAAGLIELGEGWPMLWLVFRVVGSVVTVPLAEELAFRGYLMRRLMSADFEEVPIGRFSWLSFLVSSIAFGMLHGRWLVGMAAGMLYALALYRRRELADAVLAHATTNALIAAHVLTMGEWSLWG